MSDRTPKQHLGHERGLEADRRLVAERARRRSAAETAETEMLDSRTQAGKTAFAEATLYAEEILAVADFLPHEQWRPVGWTKDDEATL